MARRRRSVETALRQEVPPGSGVLVALSGGRDSCVLLRGLLKIQGILKLRVEACHIDHGLRPNSGRDGDFVSSACKELGVACAIERLGARPAKSNLEAWARVQRYRVLREVLERRKLDWIVTAHNANDVAETLLIRLFANKELNSIERCDARRRVIRPLLGVTRSQIDEYAATRGIAHVEDPTNTDTSLVRNRIRHNLLPLLEQSFDPSMAWILAERAQALAQDCEALQVVADEVAQGLGGLQLGDAAWVTRAHSALAGVPYGVRWRAVQALLVPVLAYEAGEKVAAAVCSLLEKGSGKVQLRGGLALTGDRFGLALHPPKTLRLSEA